MSHNGFNTYRKGYLGGANVGRYLCGACGKSVEEDRAFWGNLKTGFFDVLTEICLRLRLNHVSYELIEEIMSFIYPRDVTGGLKLLNSGGIKKSTCQSPTSKLRGCVDAGPGGIPHAARFIQPRIEHQRDSQKNRTQPWNG
jgi:hypothetical protein